MIILILKYFKDLLFLNMTRKLLFIKAKINQQYARMQNRSQTVYIQKRKKKNI